MTRLALFMTLLSFVVFVGCDDSSDGDPSDSGATDTDTDADTDTDSDTDSDSDTDTDTDTDTDSDTDSDTDLDAGLEIIGSWEESWGATHEITATSWTVVFPGFTPDAGPTTSSAAITQYDNALDYLVAQNDSVESYFPDKWSRYDWVQDALPDGGVDLYYCQIEFAADDEATAAANTSADHGNLSSGCAGTYWSPLYPQ